MLEMHDLLLKTHGLGQKLTTIYKKLHGLNLKAHDHWMGHA